MTCPECNNTRFIYTYDKDGEPLNMIPCEACKQYVVDKELEKKLLKSEIPLQYHEYTFDSYEGKDEYNSLSILKDYVNNIDNMNYRFVNLFLYGEKSCQKTTLASVVGKELLKKNKEVKFILAGDLIKLLMKESSFNTDKDIRYQIDKYKKSEFLIIDDIFDIAKSLYWSSNNNLVITEWDLFLRYRLGHGLRIITTSNFDMSQIGSKFGSSIQSLFNRNFKSLQFSDNIEKLAMEKIENIFD